MKKSDITNTKLWKFFQIKNWSQKQKIDGLQWLLRSIAIIGIIWAVYSHFKTQIDAWVTSSKQGLTATGAMVVILLITGIGVVFLKRPNTLLTARPNKNDKIFYFVAVAIPFLVFVIEKWGYHFEMGWWDTGASAWVLLGTAGSFALVRSRYGVASAITAGALFGSFDVIEGETLLMFFGMLTSLLIATLVGLGVRWLFFIKWSNRIPQQA